MIRQTLLFGLAGILSATRAVSAQCAVHPTLPISAADCGASPTLSVDQTPALQGAINASCAMATGNGGAPPVYIPAGRYLFVNLSIPCSGLVLYGAGSGGFRGGPGGT